MSQRRLLPETSLSPRAAQAMQGFHADVVEEVAKAVQSQAVVVVGMKQNPVVKKARRALEATGTKFAYLEYGSYMSEWKKRLAIKLWSGWPTFPQVFVNGVLIGGFSDLKAGLADGSIKLPAKK